MAHHQNIGEWQGKDLVDRNGEKIGKLEDVYVDVETDEPMFGTVKEGLIGRHLTFVPLAGITIGPDNLQVAVSREQVKSAPNIELHGDELSKADESTLYHHYQLNYIPPDTERGLWGARTRFRPQIASFARARSEVWHPTRKGCQTSVRDLASKL
jgi:PRC-barrel domain